MSEDGIIYKNLDANKVLDAFGKYGKYQMLIYAMANSVQVIYALNMMIMPFISETPSFECNIPDEDNLTRIDKCFFYDTQNKTIINCPNYPGSFFEYKNETQTLAAQFDLVCDNAGGLEHGSSIFLLGGMLLAPVIMQLSDIYGRKWPFIICIYFSLASNIGCAFAPSYIVFLILRFIAGMCGASIVTIGQTIALESVSVEFRNMLPILFNTFWIIGYLGAGIIKLFTNSWRALYLIATLPGLLYIPYAWWVPETLHYLVTMKRYDDVKTWIKKAEQFNGKKIDLRECYSLEKEETKKSDEIQRTVLDVFKNSSLFVNFIINGYVFIVMSFSYWALSLFSTEFSSDKMVGFFLSGLVEIPGGILACLMVIYCPRKLSSMSSMAIQGIAMAIAAFISPSSPIMIALPLIAKLFNSVAWSSHPLLLSESSPTTLRNSILAVCTVLGEAGGVAAPYLKRLEAINEKAPALVIGIMSGVAAIGILALPETKGKELASDIDDPNYNAGPLMNFILRKKKKEEIPVEKEEMLEID